MTQTRMPLEELLAQPPAMDLRATCRAINIGKTSGYAMVKAGEFPLPVLRIGKQYRVRRSDVLAYLGIDVREQGAVPA